MRTGIGGIIARNAMKKEAAKDARERPKSQGKVFSGDGEQVCKSKIR